MQVDFQQGITDRQIEQLIDYSNTDLEVKEFTSDPERFRCRESFVRWKSKEREIYVLTNNKKDLLGIIWFGPKKFPMGDLIEKINCDDFGVSFAIRIYGEARGKGLAMNFIKKSLGLFEKTDMFNRLNSKKIWLEVSDDNIPAKSLYQKFGFRQITRADGKNKILMIL